MGWRCEILRAVRCMHSRSPAMTIVVATQRPLPQHDTSGLLLRRTDAAQQVLSIEGCVQQIQAVIIHQIF